MLIDWLSLIDGWKMLMDWSILILIPIGVLIGVIIGSIPGFNIAMGMAIVLPFTFHMPVLSSIVLLSSMFTGSCFGGAISAILINTPGMESSIGTTFDGYPMTKNGQYNEALGIALGASTLGGLIGFIFLTLAVEPLANAVLRFGPPEMFLIAVMGLTLIASLSDSGFAKSILAGSFGILLGTVGMNPVGLERGTFGSYYLLDGFPVIPVMIGLFAISELLLLMDKKYIISKLEKKKMDLKKILNGFFYVFSRPIILLRSGTIGAFIGAIPGVGAAVANLVSYNVEKNRNKKKNNFGKGEPDGVLAAEAANSSSEGGSTATMLALGIPGGSATAILIGAFMLQGLVPGPRLFIDEKPLIYAFMGSNYLQLVILILLGLLVITFASNIVRIPTTILIPTILVMAVIGAFSLRGTLFDPFILLVFSIVGYFMRKNHFPVAAVVIGLILGKMADRELLRTYQMFDGNFFMYFTRPISVMMILVIIIALIIPLMKQVRRSKKIENT